jgi:rhodanese-related sulfurtransferase
MKQNKLINFRLLLETFLLYIASLSLGLFINHHIVSQGFDGSLIIKIKNHLKSELEEKVQNADSVNEKKKIIIIHAQQAKDFCDNGQSLFVDARPAHAYVKGHIHGAINITEQTLDDYIFDLMDKAGGNRIILYCENPECPQAMELAELLVENDISPVFVYPGGWDQWVERGYPTSLGTEP